MYQKILVPLDGSDYSESVLEHVKAVALGCSVPEVVLLSVIEPFPIQSYRASKEWLTKLKNDAKSTADTYLSSVATKLKPSGITAETAVIEGLPAEAIIDYARKNKVDLIIMSTHGRSGISRWVYGSVADRVVRNSVVPVLAAPPLAILKK